jgi:hypothetical protein
MFADDDDPDIDAFTPAPLLRLPSSFPPVSDTISASSPTVDTPLVPPTEGVIPPFLDTATTTTSSSEGDTCGLPPPVGPLITPDDLLPPSPLLPPPASSEGDISGSDSESVSPALQDVPSPQLGRGKRIKIPNQWTYGGKARLAAISHLAKIEPNLTVQAYLESDETFSDLNWDSPFKYPYHSFYIFEDLGIDPATDEVDWWHPMILSTKSSSADEPRYFEILRLPLNELEEWFVAMEVEVDGLSDKDTYNYH